MQLDDLELQNLALLQIVELLQSNHKSLKDYPLMPFPTGVVTCQIGNKLIYVEHDYDINQLNINFQTCFTSLTRDALN